jgi:intein-encoded DNA endonuclease-like protein
MKSNRSFHTIRDHFYHQRKILAGMCGINLKKCNSFNILNLLQEWLKTKKHIKKTAIVFNTDPGKLSKYIVAQGHNLLTFNPHVFNKINTEEQAYWLGFLFADGNIDENRNALELSLQISDKEHLEKFYKFLDCQRDVKTDSYRCRTSLTHKDLIKDLVNIGCTSRKSLSIQFPILPKKLRKHFIRGYFDGDGSITKSLKSDILYTSVNIASGSQEFVKEIVSIFNEETKSNCKQTGHKSKSSNIHLVCLKNTLCKSFLNWLYKDANIYMQRKYERYLNSIAVLNRNV